MVFDAPRLRDEGFSLDRTRLVVQGDEGSLLEGRGWLRRYAPTAWSAGAVAGSLEAVTKRTFLSLIGSISRLGGRKWLTSLDAMLDAEDRLRQLDVAAELGLLVPETLVSSSVAEIADRLGERFVVKPLSGGYYWTEDGPRAVFASELTRDGAAAADFTAAPFVAQQLVEAERHLRVVTVESAAWCCWLDAGDRPLDWRAQPEAHSAWQVGTDDEACDQALRLADALHVGYSSQDWIRGSQGLTFLDLNPGGQWLFLPDPVGSTVSNAIGRFLSRETR
ncbi:MAG: ATP-grasp domain-containing protein [Solirubrobacteraceae bacterium]